MVQTNELQRTKKKTDISYITYISRKRRLSEKTFFLLKKRSFRFSGKWPFWPYLDSSKIEYRWYKLMNYKELRKKQTYLISPTSREKEDFQRRLFLLTKRSFKFSGKWPFWPYLDSNKTGNRWYKLMNYKELRKNRHILYHLHLEKKKTFREDVFFLLTKRSFKFSAMWPFWPYLDSNKTEYRWYKLMNYKEL